MLVTSSSLPAARSHFPLSITNMPRTASTRSTSSSTGDSTKCKNDSGKELGAYERCIYNQTHDPRWQKEALLGRRIGLYRFRGELGQGNFSTVRLAFHQLTRDKVAIKVLDKAKLDPRTQRMLAREISNMDAAAHPNIIRLFEVVESLSKIFLVLEYAGGGELFNLISTEGKLKEGDAVCVFAQLLSAVSYLHALSIVHRDIKAENVFISRKLRVKLGDLGFSTRVSELDQALTTFCGSPPYAAPELYKDASYAGPGVDVWALGVLMFFILTAEMPFRANTVSALKRHILAGVIMFPSHMTATAQDLLKKILVQEPHLRLTTVGVADHDLLSEVQPSYGHQRSPSHLSPTSPKSPDSLSPESVVQSAPSSPSSQNSFLSPDDADHRSSHQNSLSASPLEDSNSHHQRKTNKARRSSSARSTSPSASKIQSRRHSCAPRTSHSFRSHSYVYRAFPTTPLPHYVTSPQNDVPDELLTESELESISMLEHWGISKSAISEASPLGVRSPIIGTYRILLHRILNRGHEAEDEQAETEAANSSKGKGDERSSQRRKSFAGSSPLRHRMKLVNSGYVSDTNKSRTCTII
uniref:non-specific serine/threonine protein kinase n=2 Tax=Hirondellea gigas TaxID=1518452 RepID=A0A6A7FXG3_9CRUS